MHTRTVRIELQQRLHSNKWAKHIRGWLNENRNVHVYFDNLTPKRGAEKNALTLTRNIH